MAATRVLIDRGSWDSEQLRDVLRGQKRLGQRDRRLIRFAVIEHALQARRQ